MTGQQNQNRPILRVVHGLAVPPEFRNAIRSAIWLPSNRGHEIFCVFICCSIRGPWLHSAETIDAPLKVRPAGGIFGPGPFTWQVEQCLDANTRSPAARLPEPAKNCCAHR